MYAARRREAAILFADIAGYSILMSTAGEATHARWMDLLNNTIRPQARSHGSTRIKSTGDGIMAVFPTVVDTFRWAQTVQQAIRQTDNEAVPPVALRIGINYGELIYTDDDVYGHDVNIAARLQEHCPPGGAAFTKAAFDRLTTAPAASDLGPLDLRNIEGRVHVVTWDAPDPCACRAGRSFRVFPRSQSCRSPT